MRQKDRYYSSIHGESSHLGKCPDYTPLTRPACSFSGGSKTQSRTPPFQSAIRPCTGTVTTRTSPSMDKLGRRALGSCRCCCPNRLISSSSKVLFSRWRSLHQASSSEPGSRKRAWPVIVVEMLDSALVFRLSRRLASEERVAAGGGNPSRSPWALGARVGGR